MKRIEKLTPEEMDWLALMFEIAPMLITTGSRRSFTPWMSLGQMDIWIYRRMQQQNQGFKTSVLRHAQL